MAATFQDNGFALARTGNKGPHALMAFRGNNVFVREQAQKRLVEIGELFACAEIVDQHRIVKACRQHLRELSVARQIAKIGIGRGIAGNNLLR